jgi:hypothetical protein
MLVPITDNGPALEIAAFSVTSPPVVVSVREAPTVELETALLTVIAPELWRVAVDALVS